MADQTDDQLEKIDDAISDLADAGVAEWTTEGGKHTRMIPLKDLIDAQDRLQKKKARKSRSTFQVVRRIGG